MEREILVHAAKSGDEMVFEGSDGAFGGIASMGAGGHKLVLDGFVLKEFFEGGAAFVVEAMEARAEAGADEASMEDAEGVKDGLGGAGLHGFREDGVAVVIVEDKDIVVAGAGWDDEFAGLVGVGLAGGDEGRETEMGACAGG